MYYFVFKLMFAEMQPKRILLVISVTHSFMALMKININGWYYLFCIEIQLNIGFESGRFSLHFILLIY